MADKGRVTQFPRTVRPVPEPLGHYVNPQRLAARRIPSASCRGGEVGRMLRRTSKPEQKYCVMSNLAHQNDE